MKRKQSDRILKDLETKMVLLTGPRQVGKTWLAKEIAKNFSKTLYLNYDRRSDREIIQKESWLESTELIIFDELHKMADWKNYIKGIFDTKPNHLKILVTGSAQLNTFRQVGDSLAGRYFIHHLLPFSPAELAETSFAKNLDRFIERSGFPEPFLANDQLDANRWRMQYIDSLMRTDIFEFDHIQNLRDIQTVFELLRTKVGSPISYSSIARDVGIAPNSVKKYIQIFESLFIVFRVTPFAKNIARSLLKTPKIYFFDSGLVIGDIGAKFENFTANCLLKHVLEQRDNKGLNDELHYIRTKEGEEIDFALVENQYIKQAIETKVHQTELSPVLVKFQKKYDFPTIQLLKETRLEYTKNNIVLRDARNFLKDL